MQALSERDLSADSWCRVGGRRVLFGLGGLDWTSRLWGSEVL